MEDTNYMDVAEQLYKHVNPNSRMDTPNSAYILTEKWYNEWITTDRKTPLFEWCLENKQ